MKKKLFGLVAFVAFMVSSFVSMPVYATAGEAQNIPAVFGASCGGVDTAIIKCDDTSGKGNAIFEILATALSVFTFGVSAAAVIGVIIASYQYMSARDNSQVVAKAKNRIFQIVLGLVIWVMIWVILELLLPGGLFANGN